ncbi:hypothetical protein PIGHUM_03668 [Pigmentiphaga humi]|uniref:DUF192 domain-containing protein n=1 Tax=Pigmentiphaga humi TaxID=2478468 RepID=A0A3P4B5K1_9BURK|nr:DUF192 domain-containing protein [Pigmentiphaga humi]VCU71583.1 hypothetical protein PIGHUM_03668 [Pigmentiphaga humi]
MKAPEPVRWRVARTPWQRLRGLLGRPPPAQGEAWWITPCRAVHTIGMSYAIDVVFLDAQGRVLRLVPAMPPWRMAWCPRAHSVAELAEGEARRLGWQPGTLVR